MTYQFNPDGGQSDEFPVEFQGQQFMFDVAAFKFEKAWIEKRRYDIWKYGWNPSKEDCAEMERTDKEFVENYNKTKTIE